MRDASPEASWRREQAAMEHVLGKLCQTFPDVDPDQIRAAVDACHQSFAGSRIRDYVPMLVEKEVRRELRERPDDLVAAIQVPSQRELSEATPQSGA